MFALLLSTLVVLTESCTKIVIESTNKNIDWVAGTFIIDATLVADGRPVYVEALNEEDEQNEDIIKRSLYHYSHEISEDITAYEQADFAGRWILGNSMYSANGWVYIESWSISPTDNMMRSLIHTENNISAMTDNYIHPKTQWKIFADNQWQFDTEKIVTFTCDTVFNDITKDWLFITTPNHYEFNILNTPIANIDELNSITECNLHGFYYRISNEYWRKIESKMFLRKRIVDENFEENIEYSFFFYDNYTHGDGTPNMELFDGYKLITYSNKDLGDEILNNKEWIVVDGENRQYQSETISVKIITIIDKNDNIYSAYRRYWKNIKLKSFNSVTENMNENEKNKLVINLNNGLPFMMLGVGSGGLDEKQCEQSMDWSFNIGYRVIDGAQAYQNEGPLGNILSRYKRTNNNLQRDDIFITSKVWPTDLGFIQTYKVILESLNKLKTNYFDLYMIHWNTCNPDIAWMHCELASNRPWGQTYQIMEKLYGEGYLLNIGISNYNFNTLNEIIDSHSFQIIPQIIQNYFDISHADWELAEYVNRFNIIYQGYAQYRGIAQAEDRAKNGETHYKEFKDLLTKISAQNTNGKASEAQIELRWLIEKHIAVIPRSSQMKHLRQNWNIWDFELTQNDINQLTEMSIRQNRAQHKTDL